MSDQPYSKEGKHVKYREKNKTDVYDIWWSLDVFVPAVKKDKHNFLLNNV